MFRLTISHNALRYVRRKVKVKVQNGMECFGDKETNIVGVQRMIVDIQRALNLFISKEIFFRNDDGSDINPPI